MSFTIIFTFVAFIAGAIASVAGFGIGSLLTPLLAVHTGTKIAVAAVSIPHIAGTALRLWLTRQHVDRHVLWSFGITSALGGLAGALIHVGSSSHLLTYALAALLLFAGFMGVTGLSNRLRFGRRGAWIAGAVSGVLGGMVGNQGGIRSAAMLGFDVRKEAFVATATAIALLVDFARMPVYAVADAGTVFQIWRLVALGTAGVLIGTIFGAQVLHKIPEKLFRRIVSVVVLAMGISLLLFPQR
ncbi:MAG: sulfite exporter TauE/SafE family protein [Candidatus Acidiferrales bacterium]